MVKKVEKGSVYIWEAKDRKGSLIKGEARSTGENALANSLRRQGLSVVKIRKVGLLAQSKPIKEEDVAVFTRQLATMMKSGVPLLQSFDIVSKGHPNPAVSRLLNEVKMEVEQGGSLAGAFASHPKYFDALFCNLVAAGEAAGILEGLLERLATYKEKSLAIRKKIKKALKYPISILAVAFIVTAVIMIFVVPAFKDLFSSFGADLPLPTQYVIIMSNFMVGNWWGVLIGIGLFISGIKVVLRGEKAQQKKDAFSLRAPVFGPILTNAAVARWTRTLATMSAAGVPLLDALESVAGASGNYVYYAATKKIQADVSNGINLTTSMTDSGIFPSMVLQMVQIGEESGSLEGMLSKVADFYEAEVDNAVDGLSAMMEPIIMAFLGVVIGGLVIAMYLPVFKMGQVVN